MAATRHGGGDRTTLLVPPQSGRAIDVRESELVRVIDVEGQQVGDLWVIDANDHDRWLSTSHTRIGWSGCFHALASSSPTSSVSQSWKY